MMTKRLIMTIITLQTLVFGLYMSEALLVALSLISMLGITLNTFFQLSFQISKTHDKKQSLNNVITRLKFVIFYYLRVTRKAQLRSTVFLAVVVFLLFFGIFSLDVMTRDVLTRVTNYPEQSSGHFIDVISIDQPQLTWGIDPDFSKNPSMLVKEMKTSILSAVASGNQKSHEKILMANDVQFISIMDATVVLGRFSRPIPITASVDLIVLPDDHWMWNKLGLNDKRGMEILQSKFITFNMADLNELPEEGWNYLIKYGFSPQKVLPFNMTDTSNSASIEINSTNLYVTTNTYSGTDVRNLLDHLGLGVVGITGSLDFHALLLASETMFSKSFKNFPYNTAFNRITFIVQVWFTFNERRLNSRNPLETSTLDEISATFYQWCFAYYQQQGLTDVIEIEENIRSQPIYSQIMDAKSRMNDLLVLSALELAVIILFTSIIVYTELTTFSADDKQEVFHKLILRGLSIKKHVPFIDAIEKTVILMGSIFFGFLFFVAVILIGEVMRCLPFSLVPIPFITWHHLLEAGNRSQTIVLLITAIIQLSIIIIVLHQMSLAAILKSSPFTLGGQKLMASASISNISFLSSPNSRQSIGRKTIRKYQLLIHVIGLLVLLLLSEIVNWLASTNSSSLQLFIIKSFVFYVALLLVTSLLFTYYPRILLLVSQKKSFRYKSTSFSLRHVLMRTITEKPPVQLRILILLVLSLTLLSVSYHNIQKDRQNALIDSFTTIGADIRVDGIDIHNDTIITQIQSISGVDITSPVQIARLTPTRGSKTYTFIGLELSSFYHILENRKTLVRTEILALTSALKSKTETLRQEDNINLTNPIPVLAHRLLQDELTIGTGTVITLSFPSYKETGKQRYDLTLEIVDFFTNFPSIKATPSLMVDDASLEIPMIIPMPILNTLITTIDLPASEQNKFLLLTVKEENKINDVTQDIISRFSYFPTITVQKRLTSRELDQVLPQLDIYESMRTNQMLQIEVAVIIIVIFFFFILHFRQWINRYESLALLFGATPTSLKREYLIEITFYMISIIILAELTALFLAVISNGISALTFNTFLEQVLRLFIPILVGTILMTVVLVSFILTRPIKITKATLPRFTS